MTFSLHYLPCIQYFSEITKYSSFHFSSTEKYQKQSYRNRAYILGSQKIETLIIPVHATSLRTQAKDVKIDNHAHWQRRHWRTIETAYRKAPFWDFYFEDLKKFYDRQYNFLQDFNIDILTECLQLLGQEKTVCQHEKEQELSLFDLNAKKREESHPKYRQVRYIQNFGNDFVPNLSIIDLLMCMGPEALSVLHKIRLE